MLTQDDVIETSFKTVPPKKYLKDPRAFKTARYSRITPSYIRAVAAYLNLSMQQFCELVGLNRGFHFNFNAAYEPNRNYGSQATYQCGLYWIVAILYHEGYIPYGLARLGGIYDKEAERTESYAIRKLMRHANKKARTTRGRRATTDPGKSISEDRPREAQEAQGSLGIEPRTDVAEGGDHETHDRAAGISS